jgi:hypothetical protein
MKKTSKLLIFVCLIGTILLLPPGWLLGRADRTGVQAAPSEQQEVDITQIVDRMNRWHLSAFRGYKFKSWVSIGDVVSFAERIADGDVQAYVDPAYLGSIDANAAYVDCAGIACATYMNDLVLADQPVNVDPKTLWHESMHAIFDNHDSELLVSTDEIYTWYVESVVTVLEQILTSYEREYDKGDQCDQARLDQYWSMFERRMQDAKEGRGLYGPITSDAQLAQLRQLTGFYVDVGTIRANYEAVGMDKCPALTPTVQPNLAVAKSVILVIDASGSMVDNNKIEQARAAAKNLLGSMGAGQEVGLMPFYDCGSIAWTPFSTDLSSLVPIVDAIQASGSTPLGASIREAGGRMSREASGKEGVVIVLIDGGESCSDNPVNAAASVFQMTLPRKTSYTAPFAASVAYADGGDIVVSVVGFDIDDPQVEQELRAIAEAGGGEFFTAKNVDELNRALKKAAGGNPLPRVLLAVGGVAACVLPLLLVLVVILILASRRGRTVAVPAGYGYAPQPRYAPPPPPQRQYAPPPRPGSQPQYAPPQGQPAGMGELVLLRGQAQPPGLALSQPVVRLGRATQGNDVLIRDPAVSGHHAEIRLQVDGHWIHDLRSTNGTLLNGVRVLQPQPLRDGDRIALGGSEWTYRRSGDTMMMPSR